MKSYVRKPVLMSRMFVTMAVFGLLAELGCTSSAKQPAEGQSGSRPQIDVNCIGDRINNPPEAFHYSYKTDGANAVDKEADLTPQSMDITIQDKSGSHKYHGVRSDEGSWSSAVVDLSGSGFTVMSARVAFITDNSAVKPAGAEAINGYQTTKYAIDTSSANPSDKQTYETMFGAGSYEKGAMWVTAEGCPVKLTLDEATKEANGGVDKVHYELAMIKK